MFASLVMYKLWKTTMEHMFEKEDLWEVFEPINRNKGRSLSKIFGASRTTIGTTPTCWELELKCMRKRRAFEILKLFLTLLDKHAS